MSIKSSITPISYNNFGRLGVIEIWRDGRVLSDIVTDGLDFKFQTNDMFNANDTSIPNSSSVQILGLNRNSVDYLAKFTSVADYLRRNISVRILVGYESDTNGMQEVLHMPVISVIPSAPPENWLTFNTSMLIPSEQLKSYSYVMDYTKYGSIGKSNYEVAAKALKEDLSKVSVAKLFEALSSSFGVSWIWHGDAKKAAEANSVDFFGYNGGVQDMVDALRKKYRWLKIVQSAYISKSNGKPTVYDIYLSENYNRESDGRWRWQIRNIESDVNHWLIDKEHGMIGLPSWSGGNGYDKVIQVRTLLNPSFRKYDVIDLRSDICKDLSGKYRVITVKQTGHLRGNEWYSDIKCSNAV